MSHRKFRWGIIGCGLIAPRFTQDLFDTGEGTVVAAASRSSQRAQHFQKITGVPNVYTSYQTMLEQEKLDAVYIATTHNFHAENARLCLEHNLPVLIEKAFTQNARQAEEIITLARQKNLFMMEAMWTRFCPAALRVQQLLAEQAIGDLQQFHADFCVRMSPFSKKMMPWNRMYSPRLAGGALLDIGIYPIAYSRMIFGQQPTTITSSAQKSWSGIDTTSRYHFTYPSGAESIMKSSFTTAGSRDARIIGSAGRILIPSLHSADQLILKQHHQPDQHIACGTPSFQYQIKEVHHCLQNNLTESTRMPLDETLQTMQLLDTLRQQWNLTYPGD